MTGRTGIASDRGLHRTDNEDRVFVDHDRGIYLVVDGLGGQAAGERAAEIAVDIIAAELGSAKGDLAASIADAITAANNEIFRQAEACPEWHGMSCVLTLAVARNGRVTVGHVGDTRLYLAWDGKLRKLTPDHAPVGEQEDLGEITEEEAMAHPRRHEVFRDVGSRPRTRGEDDFLEIRTFPFHSDAAFLLCSDGLTDAVTSTAISSIIETYDGDPQSVAERLVDAANRAGGHDNVSVIFVAGPEFLGLESRTMLEARQRHSTTRPRAGRRRWLALMERAAWLTAGITLGIVIWHGGAETFRRVTAQQMDPSDPDAIQKAMSSARPGETVTVPPGRYNGPIELKTGVTLRSAEPGAAVVQSTTAAFVARGVRSGRVSGFRVTAGPAAALSAAVIIEDSNLEMDDMDISGTTGCGVRLDGTSTGVLRANYIHDNAACGVWVGGDSATRLTGNRISANGMGSTPGPGVEIHSPAHPSLENNILTGNGLPGFGDIPTAAAEEIRSRNVTDPPSAGQPRSVVPPVPASDQAHRGKSVPSDAVEATSATSAGPPATASKVPPGRR